MSAPSDREDRAHDHAERGQAHHGPTRPHGVGLGLVRLAGDVVVGGLPHLQERHQQRSAGADQQDRPQRDEQLLPPRGEVGAENREIRNEISERILHRSPSYRVRMFVATAAARRVHANRDGLDKARVSMAVPRAMTGSNGMSTIAPTPTASKMPGICGSSPGVSGPPYRINATTAFAVSPVRCKRSSRRTAACADPAVTVVGMTSMSASSMVFWKAGLCATFPVSATCTWYVRSNDQVTRSMLLASNSRAVREPRTSANEHCFAVSAPMVPS